MEEPSNSLDNDNDTEVSASVATLAKGEAINLDYFL